MRRPSKQTSYSGRAEKNLDMHKVLKGCNFNGCYGSVTSNKKKKSQKKKKSKKKLHQNIFISTGAEIELKERRGKKKIAEKSNEYITN